VRIKPVIRGALCLCLAVSGAAELRGQRDRAVTLAPRPLSAAEREAVIFAAEYLARGPEAFWDRLARGSALHRLGRTAALEEIEVRGGLPRGAKWELSTAAPDFAAHGAVFTIELPSGIEETLTLELSREPQGWALAGLSIAAEPGPTSAPGVESEEQEGTKGTEETQGTETPEGTATSLPPWLPWAGGVAGALLAGLAVLLRERRLLAAALAAAAVVAVGAGFAGRWAPASWLGAAEGLGLTTRAGDGMVRLAPLLPLRRTLTRAEGEIPTAAPPETRQPGVAGDVARLWWAQHLLGSMELPAAERILAAFPTPGPTPMVELLRARLGFLRLEELPTALAYERAVETGVRHEALLLESAQALLLLGFHDHARSFLDQLARMGARRPDSYYARAELAVVDNEVLAAGESFLTGWRLEPIPRSAMFDQPLLTALLDDPEVRKLVALDQPTEPIVLCMQMAERAIALPAGFTARLSGEWLLIEGGGAELSVPGGCDLAPVATETVHAGQRARERETEALAGLADLQVAVRSPGAAAQPALRRKVHETAEALAMRQRWEEVVALTDNLTGEVAILPPELVRLRAGALTRLDRRDEARRLLIGLAKGGLSDRRRDPATLYQLSELLAEAGEYEAAIKLTAKANSQLPFDVGDDRLRQLQMERRLAGEFKVYESPHFTLQYPPGREEAFAVKAARILEEERARLQTFIPLSGSAKKIEVLLFPFEDFRLGYSPALDVLGLYDGKIRLPLGDVRRFVPFVVSLMSHELAHAMIAERTNDRAPRWFHEGLAQHVQMVQEVVNPIHGYALKKSLVSFPLLEPAINSYSPALVVIGYDETAWVLHFIETRWGKQGIHRLLDAFRSGQTTDEALLSALGKTPEEFDRELWHWCLEEAPAGWKVEVVAYDEEEDRRFR
jgi:hypothetical protein